MELDGFTLPKYPCTLVSCVYDVHLVRGPLMVLHANHNADAWAADGVAYESKC